PDEGFERRGVPIRCGEGCGPNELRRSAGTRSFMDAIPIRFAEPECENHLRLRGCLLLLRLGLLLGAVLRGRLRVPRALSAPLLASRGYSHGFLHREEVRHLDTQCLPEGIGRRILPRQFIPVVFADAVAKVGDAGLGTERSDFALTEVSSRLYRDFGRPG